MEVLSPFVARIGLYDPRASHVVLSSVRGWRGGQRGVQWAWTRSSAELFLAPDAVTVVGKEVSLEWVLVSV